MEFKEQMLSTRQHLDAISKSFCIAKWSRVTLHLESGHNHSCHHPKTHKTSVDELNQIGFSALHNTEYKLLRRKEMLEGVRPKECDFCWKYEDLNQQGFSDRVIKSSSDWSRSQLQKILNNPLDKNHAPSYVEVSFSNTCNLKCSYCSANFSSSWKNELDQFGNYQTHSGALTSEILPEETNVYINAFWQWWPVLIQSLQVLRITGGEPLLSKNTFKVLEQLSEKPSPHLELAINSNLSVSRSIIEKFSRHLKILEENRFVKSITLYTSIEATRERAEYIRHGLDYELFVSNLEYLLVNNPTLKVTIMSTFNLLSASSYLEFLKLTQKLNARCTHSNREKPIWVDTIFLKDPAYQSVQLLPLEFESYFLEIMEYMRSCSSQKTDSPFGFDSEEIANFERVYQLFLNKPDEEKQYQLRQMFYIFFNEHDRRRKTQFLATFPEYKKFWQLCERNVVKHYYLRKIKRLFFNR